MTELVRGIPRELLFGSIEILEVVPRRKGNKLVMRGRLVKRDEFGHVTSDKTEDTGLAMVLPDERWAANDCLRNITSVVDWAPQFIEPETWRDRWARKLNYWLP